ncbi:MAG TPA: hypothetical protein VF713_02910, partial [Thermoanaerobaculia bacterium]
RAFPTVTALLNSIDSTIRHPWLRPIVASLASSGTSLLRVLQGHGAQVNSVAMTPNGLRAISASDDRTLRIWDLERGEETSSLHGHLYAVQQVVISDDGRRAASISQDCEIHPQGMSPDDTTIQIWDLEQGVASQALHGHTSQVLSIAMDGSGRRLISGSRNGVVKWWDVEKGEALHAFPSPCQDPVWAVAVSADGSRSASARHRSFTIYDANTLQEIATISTPAAVTVLAMSRSGERLIAGLDDGTLHVWNEATRAETRTLHGDSCPISAVAVSADGRRAAVAHGYSATITVWNLDSCEPVASLAGHTDLVRAVAANVDCSIILSGSHDRTSRLWDLKRGEKQPPPDGHQAFVRTLTVSADGRTAISAADDQTLKVWDLARGRELRTLHGHTGPVWAVADTIGKFAMSYSPLFMIKIWDVERGEALHTLEDVIYGDAAAIRDDRQEAYWGTNDGIINVFEIGRGRTIPLTGHTGAVHRLCVSAHGRWMVSASMDHTLRIWDLESPRELHVLHESTRFLAISGDGTVALSAREDGPLQVWDVQSGREIRTLLGHTGGLFAMALSEDGRRAISSSRDRTVRVWEVDQGREGVPLRVSTSVPDKLAITPDGRRAILGAWDGTLKLVDLDRGEVIASFTCEGHPTCCAVTPDGETIMAGGPMGAIDLLRLARPTTSTLAS